MKNAEDTIAVVQKSYENRTLFEKMVNPQLIIHRGGRTYFRSDIYVKRDVETNQALLKEIKEKKYYLFLFTQKKNPIPGYPAKEMTGLGSGYSGTEHGITLDQDSVTIVKLCSLIFNVKEIASLQSLFPYMIHCFVQQDW